MAELQLKGKPYNLVRSKLREWLKLETIQQVISKAVENKNIEEYARQLYVLISTALSISIDEIFDAPWFEIAQACAEITNINQVREIPLIQFSSAKQKEVSWEYDGRDWYWWLNIFAKNYGWTSDIVTDLDPNDAISLYQEILVDEQLQKEWEWGLSEVSVSYDKNTKKSTFNPLTRPSWMQEGTKVLLPATKVKFRKDALPIGKIIGEDGSERIVN